MLSPCFATAAAPGLSAAEFGPASLAGFRAIMHRGGAGVPLIRKFCFTPIGPPPWYLSLVPDAVLVLSSYALGCEMHTHIDGCLTVFPCSQTQYAYGA